MALAGERVPSIVRCERIAGFMQDVCHENVNTCTCAMCWEHRSRAFKAVYLWNYWMIHHTADTKWEISAGEANLLRNIRITPYWQTMNISAAKL